MTKRQAIKEEEAQERILRSARLSLSILSKHMYRKTGSWVKFDSNINIFGKNK